MLRSHFQLSFEGFARYLMDAANSAIADDFGASSNNSGSFSLEDEEAVDMDMDMDQPLSRYYIATSHNTYLVGHQLKGHSSVQLYREVRCFTYFDTQTFNTFHAHDIW